MAIDPTLRDALSAVTPASLARALTRAGVKAFSPRGLAGRGERAIGEAYTLRMIPARGDAVGDLAAAVDAIPEGAIVVIDTSRLRSRPAVRCDPRGAARPVRRRGPRHGRRPAGGGRAAGLECAGSGGGDAGPRVRAGAGRVRRRRDPSRRYRGLRPERHRRPPGRRSPSASPWRPSSSSGSISGSSARPSGARASRACCRRTPRPSPGSRPRRSRPDADPMFFPASKVIYFLITPSNLFLFTVLAGACYCRRRRGGGAPEPVWRARGLSASRSAVWRRSRKRSAAAGAALRPPSRGRPAAGRHHRARRRHRGGPVRGARPGRRQRCRRTADLHGRPRPALPRRAPRLLRRQRLHRRRRSPRPTSSAAQADVIGAAAHAADPGEPLAQHPRERAFSAALVQPKPGERWLLVTSAWHMPRAIGCFRQAGFTVDAFPVDYRTRGWRDAARVNGFASEGLLRSTSP